MFFSFQLFMRIVSIPKLKRKFNYKKRRNAMQEFCKMNGYWCYMLEKILKTARPKKLTLKAKEAFETKLIKWLTIINSIQATIWTTRTIDSLSHVEDMGLACNMWRKFEILYQDTRFIKHDSIFICPSI